MIKKFVVSFGLIVAFLSIGLIVEFSFGFSAIARPVTLKEQPATYTVLLVPLDSRPPCTDYVRTLASMAGIRILTPPPDILDHYRQPANSAAIREWTRQNIMEADAAILSVDMLIHGSLLASREDRGSRADRETALLFLQELHDTKPSAKLYAFQIIPRLFIADNPDTNQYRQPMAEWSALQDMISLFENPVDIAKQYKLEEQIPLSIRQRYRDLYDRNRRTNQRLLQLVENGALASLVIGQDDSAPFGLGNLARRCIENELTKNSLLKGKVFVTRGTDEVALTLLGQVAANFGAASPRVYIHYTEPRSSETIMPYMPGTMAKTIAEKMELAAALETASPESADFILVVHAGDIDSKARALARQADEIKKWLKSGKKVALIDLSKDFRSDQTLLPYLRKNGTPIYQLLSYAGWNTASNSTGAALTQATMVLYGRVGANKDTALARETARAGFIASRLLDDWYYQKVYRPVLNAQLTRAGVDPYSLQSERSLIAGRVENRMDSAFRDMIALDWRDGILRQQSPEWPRVTWAGWQIRSGLPWDRTFEIYVEATPQPAIIGSR